MDTGFRRVTERMINADALVKAIQLKCSNCYAAMRMANALGGSDSDPWFLCHTNMLKTLVDEAMKLGIDLSKVKVAVGDDFVTDSLYYKRAMGLMTEQEFQTAFKNWQGA